MGGLLFEATLPGAAFAVVKVSLDVEAPTPLLLVLPLTQICPARTRALTVTAEWGGSLVTLI